MTETHEERDRRHGQDKNKRRLDKRVILLNLGGFILQTATIVAVGIWWSSHFVTKQDEHSRILVAHELALRGMAAAQERIVRLETIAERLERVTTRLEDRVNNGARR